MQSDSPDPVGFSQSTRILERLYAVRQMLIFGEITTGVAERFSAQLLALAAEGEEPIRVFLHSPGGHVEAADTMFDLIRAVRPRVLVIGTGWVASAGALIFASVPRAHRYALPNTRFLLHQPLGGVGGPATDVEIEARQIAVMRRRLTAIFSEATGQPPSKIEKDTDRNYWLSAGEAVSYGLLGHVIGKLSDIEGC